MMWEKKKIGDLCDVGRGSSPRPINNPAFFEGGEIPWIKIADATASGKYIYKTREVVTELGASYSRRLKAGALIIATSGVSLGQIKFLGVEGCIHDGWLYVNNFKGVDKEFLYYRLLIMQEEFLGMAYGAAIQNINTDMLRESEINLPPLVTQHKIATTLSAYDDLLENNLNRIKLLEEAAQLEFKIILRDEKCKDCSIDELANVVMGQSPSSNTYSDEKDGLPFHQGVTNFSNYFIEHKIYCKKPIKIAEPNDILFSVRAPVGKINFTLDKICIGRGLCAFRSKKSFQNSLYQQLKTFFFKDDVVGNGAIFNSVTKTELMNVKLKTPSDDALKSFEEYAQPIYKMIVTLSLQNIKLREARDILLPRLMSGEIEV